MARTSWVRCSCCRGHAQERETLHTAVSHLTAKQVISAHNIWTAGGGQKGKRANLRVPIWRASICAA